MTDTTALTVWTIRAMPVETRDKLTRSARMRGITIGEYLTRLVTLHDELRQLSYPADPYAIKGYLTKHGLEAVHE